MEEKELSRFRRFIKPNASKILVTIIMFIVLTIIVPYPINVITGAIDTDGGNSCYRPSGIYYSTTEKPMYMAIINNWHWNDTFYIEEESVWVKQTYDADLNYLYIYLPALILLPYLASCFLEEHYRLKSLKSN